MKNILEPKTIISLGLSASLAMGTLAANTPGKEEGKPNVLFIILDDMCSWVNYMGSINEIHTPNIDKLASRAVRFDHAYAPVPLCNPSRAALLTGIPSYVTGIYNNSNSIENHPLANNSIMMPQHFRDNGYKTIISGKIFHTRPSPNVMNRMWDDMTHIDGGYGPFVRNSILPASLERQWRNFEAWTGPDSDFPDVVNSQKMIDFLGETHEKPFFAAMGIYRPHNPYTAPKRYFDLYDLNDIKRPVIIENDLDDIPQYAIDNFIGESERQYQALLSETGNFYEQMIRAYLASVSFADDRVGMIIEALEASPYAGNTIIVLIGDNGFHHGEKERWTKSALWRKACHVPFLIVPAKNQSNITPGICNSPVNLIDIYPTLIDVCQLPPVGEQLHGVSLLPLLKDVNTEWDTPSISNYLPGNFVVHHTHWNFIRYADGSHELYNIAEDEHEFHNLAYLPDYKYMVDSLTKYLPSTWYSDAPVNAVESVSEDFSSEEWDAEIRRLLPDYVRPSVGSNFNLNENTQRYFDKYLLRGAIIGVNGTPNCAIPGVIHGDENVAVAFRLANTGTNSYIEFPPILSAGKMTLHVRNGNANIATSITLQKYDEEYWSTITELPVQPSGNFSQTSIDEIIEYDININEEVILRIHGGDRFVQLYRVDIEAYGTTGITRPEPKPAPFSIHGRRIIADFPVKISIYNMLGKLVYENELSHETVLPEQLGKGVFVVKWDEGSQKILLP
jgi:arylsulfatase A-like enzyme